MMTATWTGMKQSINKVSQVNIRPLLLVELATPASLHELGEVGGHVWPNEFLKPSPERNVSVFHALSELWVSLG